ncbi:MAG: TlpA family protein disulfide reductase [Alphaproteobacteria bacterium]
MSQKLSRRALFLTGSAAVALSAPTTAQSLGDLFKKKDKLKKFTDNNMFAGRSFKGKKAPSITFQEWVANQPSSTRGKPILLKFFATWCPVCRSSPPLLNRIQAELGHKLTIIALSNEDSQLIRDKYISRYKVNYPVARDGSMKLYNKYQMREAYPHYVIIDRGGIVRYEGILPINDYPRMKARIMQKARI